MLLLPSSLSSHLTPPPPRQPHRQSHRQHAHELCHALRARRLSAHLAEPNQDGEGVTVEPASRGRAPSLRRRRTVGRRTCGGRGGSIGRGWTRTTQPRHNGHPNHAARQPCRYMAPKDAPGVQNAADLVDDVHRLAGRVRLQAARHHRRRLLLLWRRLLPRAAHGRAAAFGVRWECHSKGLGGRTRSPRPLRPPPSGQQQQPNSLARATALTVLVLCFRSHPAAPRRAGYAGTGRRIFRLRWSSVANACGWCQALVPRRRRESGGGQQWNQDGVELRQAASSC